MRRRSLIGHAKTGSTRILFVCPLSPETVRQTIRPGRLNRHEQQTWKTWIESLVASKRLNTAPDQRAVNWLVTLPDPIYAKIAATGLVDPHIPKVVQRTDLSGFYDDYLKSLDVKASTKVTYGQTKRVLVGTKALLADATPMMAERFRQWMADDQGLSPVTVSRRIKTAQQAFRKAVKWKLIADNPFEDVKAGPQTNASRQAFISREMIDKVLTACPDDEWRAIVALARFGGLRYPSELLLLRWADIDSANKRFKVYSKKNERFASKRERMVPLFPELKPYLAKLKEAVGDQDGYVITRYRDATMNLRTHFHRIIKRAGLEPWERLFNNLRSSRETELAKDYPIHVTCYWIGNSPRVATDHYLQVREEDFAQATSAAQKAAQQTPAGVSNEP